MNENETLAYFITFTTYGTWLHGRDPGSVIENTMNREHRSSHQTKQSIRLALNR